MLREQVKRILIMLSVLVALAAQASAQHYQYQSLKLGMTVDEAKSALLIHYADQQINCQGRYCNAYETFGKRPLIGYPNLGRVPSVSVRFGASNRVCGITASDPITSFEVFRLPFIRIYGNPNSVEEDGNELEWNLPTEESMRVYQFGGSSHLDIHSKTYR